MKIVQRSLWADVGLHCLWFMAAILLAFGLHVATRAIRAQNELDAVNSILTANGARLSAMDGYDQVPFPGRYFHLSDGKSTAILFTLSAQSVSARFIAVYHPDRGIQQVVPVDEASRISASRLPAGLLQLKLSSLVRAEKLR